jgi:uncharacterized membrane protein YfcA
MAGKRNQYLELMGIAAQMGVTIFLGAYFGRWLDQQYPSDKKWFTMIMTILAVVVSLYLVIKQVNKLNQDEK